MNEFILEILLLAMPILTASLKTNRTGLVLGLLTILILISNEISPWLLPVPAFCFLLIFLVNRKDEPIISHKTTAIPFNFTPLLLAFFASTTLIIGSGSAISVLQQPSYLSIIGFIFGPLYFGASIDKRGFMFPWITFLLILEFSILFTLLNPLYLNHLGSALFALCQSGFYVLMPRTIALLYGQTRFTYVCSFMSIWSGIFLFITPILHDPTFSIIMSIIAPALIFLVWQRRYILLIDND